MSGVNILVRKTAEQDACAYFLYLRGFNLETANRWLVAIDETVAKLALQPLKGRLRHYPGADLKNIRSWRVDGF